MSLDRALDGFDWPLAFVPLLNPSFTAAKNFRPAEFTSTERQTLDGWHSRFDAFTKSVAQSR